MNWNQTASAALLMSLLAIPSAAEMRDFSCTPSAVKVDLQKIEILCAEPIVLNDRSQDRFREVHRFAYPMVSQNFQPLLGSQGNLLEYFLDVAQNAVIHQRRLHVWFEADLGTASSYGCDPLDCREFSSLALTREPAASGSVTDEQP